MVYRLFIFKNIQNLIKIFVFVFLILPNLTLAKETHIKLVSALPVNSIQVKFIQSWLDTFNKEGEGLLKINFLGGPNVIPSFEIGNAVQTGVIDLGLTPGSFYTNVIPEADVLKLSLISSEERRKNGGHEFINLLWNKKNLVYLGNVVENQKFYLYFNREVNPLNLSGIKIRGTTVHRDFLRALGASYVSIPPNELLTALQNRVIDGYAWGGGITELGLEKYTKFKIETGFYDVAVHFIMNSKFYQQLNLKQKQFLNSQIIRLEKQNNNYWNKYEQEENSKLIAAGVIIVKISNEQSRKFLDYAYQSAWVEFKKNNPESFDTFYQLLNSSKSTVQ